MTIIRIKRGQPVDRVRAASLALSRAGYRRQVVRRDGRHIYVWVLS